MKEVKIAYIGGGSRNWARTFMGDLALQGDFCGEIRLYDIDVPAAKSNKIIGEKLQKMPQCASAWSFSVPTTLEQALVGVDFVVISILPATFKEMRSDVHAPERFGIYQSVGDTAGAGGVLRAMRTVPIFQQFARAIKEYCPKAFVINFTNPMTLCTRALFDTFPQIRAFGCCHEVFAVQRLLAEVVKQELGEDCVRQDIKTEVAGVNHFTWFTKAEYKGIDLFPHYSAYISKNFNIFNEEIKTNPFASSERVKMDLFKRYGQIAAAGDRHLAEFVNGRWYLASPEQVAEWGFGLTSVDWRVNNMKMLYAETDAIVAGKSFELKQSGEEFVLLMKAVLGLGDYVSNVNLPNLGQASFAPKNAVVETNALFSKGKVEPIAPKVDLLPQVKTLVSRTVFQQENLFTAIKNRDLDAVFNVFMTEAGCSCLTWEQGRELFNEMVDNTKEYLTDWK